MQEKYTKHPKNSVDNSNSLEPQKLLQLKFYVEGTNIDFNCPFLHEIPCIILLISQSRTFSSLPACRLDRLPLSILFQRYRQAIFEYPFCTGKTVPDKCEYLFNAKKIGLPNKMLPFSCICPSWIKAQHNLLHIPVRNHTGLRKMASLFPLSLRCHAEKILFPLQIRKNYIILRLLFQSLVQDRSPVSSLGG